MQHSIAKTAFLTSLISYGVFLLFEYLRPGFVQYVFSVHWFLVAVIGTGIWLSVAAKDQKSKSKLWRLVQLIVGLLLMIIMLREGEVFGDFRIIMALVGLVLPFALARGLRSSSSSS